MLFVLYAKWLLRNAELQSLAMAMADDLPWLPPPNDQESVHNLFPPSIRSTDLMERRSQEAELFMCKFFRVLRTEELLPQQHLSK